MVIVLKQSILFNSMFHNTFSNTMCVGLKIKTSLFIGTTFLFFILPDFVKAGDMPTHNQIQNIPVLPPVTNDRPFISPFPRNSRSNRNRNRDYETINSFPNSDLSIGGNYLPRWKQVFGSNELEFNQQNISDLEFSGGRIISPYLF